VAWLSCSRGSRSIEGAARGSFGLGVALALLAQPLPQVLGLGVGAFAQLVGVGCPLWSWLAVSTRSGPTVPV